MQQQKYHRRSATPPSFLDAYGEYLLGEFAAIGKILGLIFLAIYLLISMLVGMYHVTIYMFWILWNSL